MGKKPKPKTKPKAKPGPHEERLIITTDPKEALDRLLGKKSAK